ncbi:MAG: FtsW/RodA/SpoVE family cell cycle protein [Patescibacteria group bacterium]|mgnify:CR=1 FL=1
MSFKSNYFDWWLILPPLLLLTISITILRSIAPSLVPFQIGFLLAGMIAFWIFSRLDYRVLVSLSTVLFIACLLFLLTPAIFGNQSRGATRWLQISQISIQPSELIKPILLIIFSAISVLNIPNSKKIILLLLAFIIPGVIIFFQPDLGSFLVLGVGWLTIFLSQFSIKKIIFLALICGLLLPTSWFFLKSYQKDRLSTFLNPYNDPLGRGYQVIQSVITVGSGQFWGRGLGHGTQSQLRFLPERHTDFIFASLSEELGFVGAGTVLVLLIIFLWRVYSHSQASAQPIGTLFCLASLNMLAFQIFVNIGMNMGIAPITGITLPFVSYGGSSLLSQSIILGIITSLSRHGATNTSLQIS